MLRRVSPLPLFLSLLFVALPFASSTPVRAALLQTYQQSGNLGLEVTGVAGQNNPFVGGNLTLGSYPATAVVQKATLYASQTNNGMNPLTATFNGVPLGAVGPTASDMAFTTLYTYQWDVTMFLFGTTVFPFLVSETMPGLGIAGVGLVVVWQDPSEPMRTVTIIDGMKQVGESGPETESVTFTGLPAGPTVAWTFTVYDDAAASGETVSYNGSAIGGPVDGNLGLNASVLQMNTTSVSGNNTLAIQTGADHMGWMVAATAVDMSPVSVDATSWSRVKSLYR